MKVLMFSWEFPPHVVGGLGTHVAELAPALARAGVEVHVVTPRWRGGATEEILAGNAVVHRVDPPFGAMGNFYADAHQTNLNLEEHAQIVWERVGGFDLIHAHDWLVAFAGASLKRLHKTPLVATIHATERGRGRGNLGGEMSFAINGAEWWLTYEAWRVICTSQSMAREVETYFQTPPNKVDVVPNGVDAAPFDALDGEDLSEFRARWASPEERIVFNVGRLVHEKGAPLIIEAAPRVLAQMPCTKFVIAGTGGMSEPLKQRVRELGIADRVNITGFISDDDRNRLLKVADTAVYPSLYEPFGIVALEAMAARCPIIVSSVGGLGEVVKLYETGITVYPDDVDSLVWGMTHTLQHPDWARARAENAYRVVKAEYNWDHIADATRMVYERILRERAQAEW
ncbi:MAG: glycosyltransferase family 4 protein [Chloroflexi bacterium]|nr:glycosyltransferase family 4 protein [Chloroflexota bacterium]